LSAFGFGNEGIDATFRSKKDDLGAKTFYFAGSRYIRDTQLPGGDGVDQDPANISAWHWPASF
jgi:hypothetical protein